MLPSRSLVVPFIGFYYHFLISKIGFYYTPFSMQKYLGPYLLEEFK